MIQNFSKHGLIATSLYVLFFVGTLLYSFNCDEGFCGLMIFLPLMPWVMFMSKLNIDIYHLGLIGLAPVLLNGVILYLLFAWIEKRAKRGK